ncbi:FAD dependent oxidoreductase-domain-containing protein [Aspergillus caelatus]|uniref:FAD dependent oxidoreductase-domain-containing protein n=1 Tax=Aspergillus caelatus TaxID=61420 RepID=A0A5N6ZZ79_9EURO|nr:FAD dependent oxidoreductase-domain-containing protein [Aspergillus caelatus]KAE8362715.1 FAD dependent oxidoreductase-domain-containing protein [Aspergillus caelatus]
MSTVHRVVVHPSRYTQGASPFEVSTSDAPLKDLNADSRHVLIVGGGVSGLLVAWMLLDKGIRVTILAKEWARTWDFSEPRITSQIAGALWEMPPGGCGLTEIETPGAGWATVEHYREWAMQSYNFYMKYAEVSNEHEKGGSSLGLSVAKLHQFFYDDAITSCSKKSPRHEHYNKYAAVKTRIGGVEVYPDKEAIAQRFDKSIINLSSGGNHFQSGYTHTAPIINTDKALAYLMALVQRKGATLETREVKDLRETGQRLLTDYKADAIVNATGLGARELVNDEDVYPVRGAVRRVENTRHSKFRHLNDAYLVPAQIGPDGLPSKTVFIVPRNDDILYVGSIIQPHNENMNLTPESPEVQQMWDRAGDFMPSLNHAGFVNHFPFAQGLRPFTKKNVKVRADEDCGFPLVHNYGHGGSGWTIGVGTAQCAVHIVETLLDDKDKTGLLQVVGMQTDWSDIKKEKFSNAIKGTLGANEKSELLDKIQASGVPESCKDRLKNVVNSWSAELIKASAKIGNQTLTDVDDRLIDDKTNLLEVVTQSDWNDEEKDKFRNAINGTLGETEKAELLDRVRASSLQIPDTYRDRLTNVVRLWSAELMKASAKATNDAIYPIEDNVYKARL